MSDDMSAADKIVKTLTDGKTAANNPRFIVVGGGMQTGQAVLQHMMVEKNFIDKSSTVIIAPGNFAGMDGFDALKHVQHPEKRPELVDAYRAIVRRVIDEAVKNGCSILLVDHAENMPFILELQKKCGGAGYETLLIGLSSEPQSYFDYANYTQAIQGRAADHPRGFRFLRDFAVSFKTYIEHFDAAVLFESAFSLKNGDPDIAIRKIADCRKAKASGAVINIHDAAAYERFIDRALLDPAATTPAEALKNIAARKPGDNRDLPSDAGRSSSLGDAFNFFAEKDFAARATAQFKKIMDKRKNGPAA
ncbi:MAG: hypothetical protein K8R48_08110 [Alphaproteobacteria bacterium]|nr:hypothetical protein [Alphaproteobacteria bacterium]